MSPIIVTGIGTDVGKTIASTIIVEALQADYWKPIQTGKEKDSDIVMSLLSNTRAHKERHHFSRPLSPHAAGSITISSLALPKTKNRLVIEGTGGVMVPLNTTTLLSDLFFDLKPFWIIVSRHYLGSINHTLLTCGYLKSRSQIILGLVFNGERNYKTEKFLLNYTKLPLIGRLKPESSWNRETIKRYAKKWKPNLASGIRS